MNDPDYHKSSYFDLMIEKQTYFNLIYSIICIPLSLVYLAITLFGMLIGIVLLPLYIGIPYLNTFFAGIWLMSKYEEAIWEWFHSNNLPQLALYKPNTYKNLVRFKSYITNARTWKRIYYFLFRFFANLIFLIPTLLLLSLTFLMIYTPINSIFGHIQIFDFFTTDNFIEVVFFYFVCVLIWVGFFHLVNISAKFQEKMTRRYLCR